jgi:hypothetical protein
MIDLVEQAVPPVGHRYFVISKSVSTVRQLRPVLVVESLESK